MLESEIKRRCRDKLESWGWEVIHLIQTSKNGIPDTLILRKTVAYFIEFKQPGNVPRKLQDFRIQKLKEQGFKTFVVTSLKDIEPLR